MFKSSGQIRIHREWWLVTHCCEDLAHYYVSVFNHANRFAGVKIGSTHWGPHISIVRNEEPFDKALWSLYHEQDIEFEYEPIYRTNGKHLWFDVKCDDMFRIRRRLGLDILPYYNLHLTLGTYHRSSDADPTVVKIPRSLLIEGEIQEIKHGEPSGPED